MKGLYCGKFNTAQGIGIQMGLFDWFQPKDKIKCPVCREELKGWQSKESENALFIWKEGVANPIDQDASEDCKLSPNDLKKYTLPEEFSIYSDDCSCPYFVVADCYCENGVWNKTTVIDASNATQGLMRKADFKKYMAWLNSKR